MKKIIQSIIILVILSFTGCFKDIVILEPCDNYHPVFKTTDFKYSEKQKIKIWVESEDINGTTKEYLVTDKQDGLDYIQNVKELRSNYNLLLKKINEFNQKVKNEKSKNI